MSSVFSLPHESSESREAVKPLDPGQTPALAGNLSITLTGAWTKPFSPDTSRSAHEMGETFQDLFISNMYVLLLNIAKGSKLLLG